jgi:hypothetical protein
LKENVIIGKLIPAGTGFVPGRFTEQNFPELSKSHVEMTEENPVYEDPLSDEDLIPEPPSIAAD